MAPEDLGVFAAAAIWTYLTLPLLLQRAEHVHRLPDAGPARDSGSHCLRHSPGTAGCKRSTSGPAL
jgi:hypothetical protein